MTKVTMRKDLIERELSIPIGENYYIGTDLFESRGEDDDFEVFYQGSWQAAYSIDFE